MQVEKSMTMTRRSTEWVAEAREKLIRLFHPGRGWSYALEGTPGTEPTALACLALRATGNGDESDPPVVRTASRWLASIQQSNGSVGVSEALPVPEWATPLAILVWAGRKEFAGCAEKACNWLLGRKGLVLADEEKIFGHDTGIVGWPWVAGTHSWIEPTAMAVLALRRRRLLDHARTREGLRLIADRSIASGGWNYGNNTVYGKTLRPQPAATGMALTALNWNRKSDAMVVSACDYLMAVVETLRAPQSLCWALLGLTAWDRRPPAAGQWLEDAYHHKVRWTEHAPQLSYLLLAAGARSLGLLGAQTDRLEDSG
jgi:hypothetical protein